MLHLDAIEKVADDDALQALNWKSTALVLIAELRKCRAAMERSLVKLLDITGLSDEDDIRVGEIESDLSDALRGAK